MAAKTDSKSPDEFILMRQIFDNLQLLDYEVIFNPLKRNLPYLSPIYFAVQGISLKEQFDYFSNLSVWLMQSFLGSNIQYPSDLDQPPSVADTLLVGLSNINFKITFPSSKLIQGYGLPVCTILEQLSARAITKKSLAYKPFQVLAGMGGETDNVEVIESDDEDIVEDDMIDVQDDVEEIENYSAIEKESTPKVIDSLELKAEAEKVSTKLQIRIPNQKSDWRAHLQQMDKHRDGIEKIMTELSPILSKVNSDVSKAIEAIDTREKNLNSRFQDVVEDYRNHAGSLIDVEDRHQKRVEEVNNLQSELNSVVDKLNRTKENLTNNQKKVADNTPLLNMKKGITNLREEIKSLELRSAILQRSLAQAWLEESLSSIDH